MIVSYVFLTADLFHYAHLRIIKKAKELGDYTIAGILTDKAVMEYKRRPIQTYEQRVQLIEALDLVDMVIPQYSKSILANLKKIRGMFENCTIRIIHGSDWSEKEFPDKETLKKLNCELVLIPYYKPLSTTKLLKKIIARDKKGDINVKEKDT